MDNKKIAKSAFSMGIFTLISRIFGLLREWLRGYLLGTSGSSDAFAIAFMFPNLLRRLVGEGAMTAAFIPVFTDYRDGDRDELESFVDSFFTAILIILIFIVVLAFVLAPILRLFLPEFAKIPKKIELTIFLTRLMFPYILFISLAALNQAILNSYRIFIPSASTPILLNISIITIGLLFGSKLRDPGIALGIGVLIGGIIQFSFQLPFLLKKDITYSLSFDFKNAGMKKVFQLMVPGAIGAGVYQINALVSQIIAASLEEGSVAALRFSNTLVEVVLGVFVISISTVILPALSEKSSKSDIDGMKKNLSFGLRLVFLITLPSTFGLLVLRYPIIRMLFKYGKFTEESTQMVAYALLFHSIGLVGIGGMRVVVQGFFSMKDTKTPVYIAVVAMAINLLLCYLLSKPLRLGGIAFASTISAYSNFLLLVYILKKKIGRIIDKETVSSFLKSAASSIIMAVVLYILLRNLSSIMMKSRLENVLITLLLIVIAIIIFFLINILLKNGDVLELKNLILRKFN